MGKVILELVEKDLLRDSFILCMATYISSRKMIFHANVYACIYIHTYIHTYLRTEREQGREWRCSLSGYYRVPEQAFQPHHLLALGSLVDILILVPTYIHA